jgi:hypothetical protein
MSERLCQMACAGKAKLLACTSTEPKGALQMALAASDKRDFPTATPMPNRFRTRQANTARREMRERGNIKNSVDRKIRNYRNKTTKKHHVID